MATRRRKKQEEEFKIDFNKVVEAMKTIVDDRNISTDIVEESLKEALAKAYRKHIEIPDALVRVEIDKATNVLKVYQQRIVVEEVIDDEMEINLENAQQKNPDFQIGDYVDEEVKIEEFGRAAVILAKNVMKQKIREAEKQAVYDEYIDKLEEMVIGIVESVEEKFCLVNIGKTLALMPKAAQIPNERYYEGQKIQVVITSVSKETKGAQVLVSRADASLVKRLFEKEVPEIYQGIIEIKAIAREAGERCKMAVYTHNENIDPIGACIGQKGMRVQAIIDELHGEKIDIFEWDEDITELIKNALAPAEVLAVITNPLKNGLMVIVKDDQLSLAIGKKGKNARLAVKLTNQTIDIKSISDVEDLGIDWKQIEMEEKAKRAAKRAEERIKAQQAIFAQAQKEKPEEMEFSEELLGEEIYEEEFVPESEKVDKEAMASVMETKPIAEEKPIIEVKKEPSEEEIRQAALAKAEAERKAQLAKEQAEIEEAARIAKEKKAQGINIEEKRAYVSKFEEYAGNDAKPATPKASVARKKKYDHNEEEKPIIRTKPTYDVNQTQPSLKPIYTEEELEEIEQAEWEEEQNQWYNDDDIDYDEYDSYYDED